MSWPRLLILALPLCIGSLSTALAADCSIGKGAKMSVDGTESELAVFLVTEPANVSVGQPFRAIISICGAGNKPVERFTIDATMPKHRHGMNYAPKVQSRERQSYTASGMFFHMPGLWRFHVSVGTDGRRQRFLHDVIVE